MYKRFLLSFAALTVLVLGSCSKDDAEKADGGNGDAAASTVIPANQEKFYLTAAEDLSGKISDKTAGIKVLLRDSKYYAVGERVLSVTFDADKDIVGTYKDGVLTGTGKSVKVVWASDDPVNRPAVEHAPGAGEYGILCAPGDYSGKFTVVTSRYTYTFSGKSVKAEAGKTVSVALDFAAPDVQPTRKVGVMGDSISTFKGELYSNDFSAFYPDSDPNCKATDAATLAKAVNVKERTWWHMVIYDKMKHGKLDVNNSWSGTRVVHETKSGKVTGKSWNAGFVDRVDYFDDPDIILLHGGRNDVVHTSPMGDDYGWDLPIGQIDFYSYKSAFNLLIKMLQNRYEGVQIIMILGDMLYSPYLAPAKEVADHYHLPYVDFSGDKAKIEKCSGSHPTYPGFQFMANKIYETCADYLP